jgi:hypothetical protein
MALRETSATVRPKTMWNTSMESSGAAGRPSERANGSEDDSANREPNSAV